VVTTAHQAWTHPPFEGVVADGCVWGRGALDMKGGVAMMLAALLHARSSGLVPSGDVVLAILSDEEAGGDYGARFLVESHPALFDRIRYAIGEFGGFTMHLAGKRFYPIMVAEKQICWLRVTIRGPGGHGAMIMRGGAMARLGTFLRRLDRGRLPVQVTPVVREMVEQMAAASPLPARALLGQLLNPRRADAALRVLGARGRMLEPLLRHTVNATMVAGGEKVNVIPSEITVNLDGRLLPGFGPDALVTGLRRIVGPDFEIELVRHDPGPPAPEMTLFPTLSRILRQADPDGIPVPMLIPGVTDARHFSRLGIQTYGFLPMSLPPGLPLAQVVHAADERVPVDALGFGAWAIFRLLGEFGGTPGA
jgi:acetylornithine deacetylase/succinyl-diaminopimelate desuccinylase-like protein